MYRFEGAKRESWRGHGSPDLLLGMSVERKSVVALRARASSGVPLAACLSSRIQSSVYLVCMEVCTQTGKTIETWTPRQRLTRHGRCCTTGTWMNPRQEASAGESVFDLASRGTSPSMAVQPVSPPPGSSSRSLPFLTGPPSPPPPERRPEGIRAYGDRGHLVNCDSSLLVEQPGDAKKLGSDLDSQWPPVKIEEPCRTPNLGMAVRYPGGRGELKAKEEMTASERVMLAVSRPSLSLVAVVSDSSRGSRIPRGKTDESPA